MEGSTRPRFRCRPIKYEKYAKAGVPHYWIVDPDEKRISVYRLRDGRYHFVAEPVLGETFEPELFHGLVIPLDDLWM
jgi:Uma2 family endonuclease